MPTRNTEENFIATGLALYKDHKDQPDVIIKFVAKRYRLLATRASRLSALKRAIIDKHHPEGDISEAVKALRLTDDQYTAIKKKQHESLVERSKRCIEVDYVAYINIVNTLRDSNNPAELTVWLLAVTGRRSSEITNGKSAFTAKSKYVVTFSGQLKTRDPQPYDIPTLAPAAEVIANYERLYEFKKRPYQAAVGRVVKQLFGNIGITKPHMLRSIYGHVCWELYGKSTKESVIQYISSILGHASYDQVANYSCIKITNVKRSIDLDEMKLATNAERRVGQRIVDYFGQHGKLPSVNWLRKKGSSYVVVRRVLTANADYLESL